MWLTSSFEEWTEYLSDRWSSSWDRQIYLKSTTLFILGCGIFGSIYLLSHRKDKDDGNDNTGYKQINGEYYTLGFNRNPSKTINLTVTEYNLLELLVKIYQDYVEGIGKIFRLEEDRDTGNWLIREGKYSDKDLGQGNPELEKMISLYSEQIRGILKEYDEDHESSRMSFKKGLLLWLHPDEVSNKVTLLYLGKTKEELELAIRYFDIMRDNFPRMMKTIYTGTTLYHSSSEEYDRKDLDDFFLSIAKNLHEPILSDSEVNGNDDDKIIKINDSEQRDQFSWYNPLTWDFNWRIPLKSDVLAENYDPNALNRFKETINQTGEEDDLL